MMAGHAWLLAIMPDPVARMCAPKVMNGQVEQVGLDALLTAPAGWVAIAWWSPDPDLSVQGQDGLRDRDGMAASSSPFIRA